MKHKKYALALAFEGIALLILLKVYEVKAESIFDLLSLPFQKTAELLGKLSLSGDVGNAAAIAAYSLICLVPVFLLLFKMKKKNFRREDSLLVLLSAVLFAVVYLLINPSEMGAFGAFSTGTETVSFAFWSLLAGYLILKFTSSLEKADSEKTEKLLSAVLRIIGCVFVFAVVAATNTTSENSGFAGVVTNVFCFANTAVPNIFGIASVFGGLNLLEELTKDKYSEETVKATDRLSEICILGVKASVVVSALYNVLQLRYISVLSDVSFRLDVPLLSLGFILAVLIMSKYVRDSKALKEDNDSFI